MRERKSASITTKVENREKEKTHLKMYIRSTYIVLSLLPVLLLNWEKKKDSWPEMYTAPWPSIHLCT
jgi:hypothetical protein